MRGHVCRANVRACRYFQGVLNASKAVGSIIHYARSIGCVTRDREGVVSVHPHERNAAGDTIVRIVTTKGNSDCGSLSDCTAVDSSSIVSRCSCCE